MLRKAPSSEGNSSAPSGRRGFPKRARSFSPDEAKKLSSPQANRQTKGFSYAATLVGPDDLVYLDAGSTVEELINHLAERGARYVTDSVSHAMKLAARGFHVTVLGGELKSATESLVGPDTIAAISRYHFTIGFWGVNGITPENGLTSPESNEALIKQLTMEHTARRYVLADATKFDNTSLVRFGAFDSATIVTCGDVPEKYKAYNNVVEVAR